MRIENSLGWEDAAALAMAAGVEPGQVVLTTTGAADHVLEILRHGPRLVMSVDPRPAQTWLAELKLAGVKALSHIEFLELAGIRDSRRRAALYRRVRWLLSPEAAAFWDERVPLIERGLAWEGRLERSIASFRRFARLADAPHGFLWRRFQRLFYPRPLAARGVSAEEWRGRAESAVGRNGPYNSALRLGRFEPLPEAFEAGHFAAIKESANRVILVTDRLERYLPLVPDECVDAVVLTEPVGPAESAPAAWRQIFRVGKPGAWIVSPRRDEDPVPGLVGQGAIVGQRPVRQRSFFSGTHVTYVISKTGVYAEAAD